MFQKLFSQFAARFVKHIPTMFHLMNIICFEIQGMWYVKELVGCSQSDWFFFLKTPFSTFCFWHTFYNLTNSVQCHLSILLENRKPEVFCCLQGLQKGCIYLKWVNPFQCQPHKMVKHTQTICQQQPTNCLSVFDHFVGLVLRGYIKYVIAT